MNLAHKNSRLGLVHITLLLSILLASCAHVAPDPEATALPPACRTDCITPYGEITGTAIGNVAAYSNCSAKCFVPTPNFVNKTYTGIKWQCVEYARRWLLVNKGVVYGDVDVAADIWSKIDHVTRVADNKSIPLQAYLNGSNTAPQIGDLIIYAKEYLGTGHVAVITEVDTNAGTVKVAEQNFLNQRWPADYARVIRLVQNQGGYWLLDGYVLGWKRVGDVET